MAPTQDVSALHLSAKAETVAKDLLTKFPQIQFTSGKRDLSGQAHAMAGNVVKNRKFIEQTYRASDARTACQKWVDDHPEATTKAAIAAGLLQTLQDLGDQAGQISKHLTGNAFDIQPVAKDADVIKKAIRAVPGIKFLDKEGGLTIWHVQMES